MCFINFLNQNQGAFLVIFSLIVALATVMYVILTGKLLSENKRLREAQTEPNVSIFPQPGVGIINLIIQNVGLGAAHNINFEVSPSSEISEYLSKRSFVKHGITYLAPNQKLFVFGVRIDDEEKTKLEPIEISVLFENYKKEKYKNSFSIDFAELVDVGMVEESSLKNIHTSLEKISQSLSAITHAIDSIKLGG